MGRRDDNPAHPQKEKLYIQDAGNKSKWQAGKKRSVF